MVSTILIVLVILCAVFGVAVGIFKKFTKSSIWGAVVLFAVLFGRMIGSSVKKTSSGYGLAVLIVTVVALIVIGAVLAVLQKLLFKAVEARRTYSHYKNYDDMEENRELILNAVDNGDKKQYKKQLKRGRKIKDSTGIWGFLDGTLGAVNGLVNALVGVAVVIVTLMLIVDLTQISFLTSAFEKSFLSKSWTGVGMALALDLPLVTVVWLSIKMGYRGGISSLICTLVILAMIGIFGYASWSIASSEACAGAVEGLKNGLLSGLSGTLGNTATLVAKIVLTVLIFLLFLVIIIITAVFLPKLCEKLREGQMFSSIDGVLGAIVLCAFIVVLIMCFGGIAYTLNDLPFMAKFNLYAEKAHFGDAVYAHNPLNSAFGNLPIRGWFKGV